MVPPDPQPTVTEHGGPAPVSSLLGPGIARLPTGGKIRAGIKVLSRRAAAEPRAQAIYEEGVAQGRSFEQIELALAEALPQIESPLVPRNVPWFTVRAQDFPNPDLAAQILALHGEDRGEGRRLYRFPVVFPTDRWQSVMPHELAVWGAHEKRYWSEYASDGRVRHCVTHAPVPVDTTTRRTVRLFGARRTMLREDNGGLCQPEACPQYQRRQCNLTGRFLFYIPGIRSISAFELPTRSFYAMNAAVQTFEAVAFLRGGRLAGFLDRQGTPFFMTKRLMDLAHRDDAGRTVRVQQWVVTLEAPVDIATLLREKDDEHTLLQLADAAGRRLQGPVASEPAVAAHGAGSSAVGSAAHAVDPQDAVPPTLEQVLGRAQAMGLATEPWLAHTDQRWGPGWRLNPRGRQRAWDELERHRHDPQGYADKIAGHRPQEAR